jgi:hypothetical protein
MKAASAFSMDVQRQLVAEKRRPIELSWPTERGERAAAYEADTGTNAAKQEVAKLVADETDSRHVFGLTLGSSTGSMRLSGCVDCTVWRRGRDMGSHWADVVSAVP